ncbi:GNAT family N-acetyltransferase [Nanchangia anserum]|uniref:GNAT family N-acetyltransferase n=1 Tax=Nanchangia anserum TaxID=2692125 RepID=A0A8I0KQR9_9ACTO|nr:GNAT family N-acetyltransferase [Nanchangia anserum]MBD3690275.1 GNAT family N-acetyltransferase [Nanchangia anserum]QOX82287.1 GNAT family N-acetyltransferase [Nanchangia anserum]
MREAARAGSGDAGLELGLDNDVIVTSWRQAVERPPSLRHRVITAGERGEIFGFAAVAPAPELGEVAEATPLAERSPDYEIVALEVDPNRRGLGHEDRLLNAVAEAVESQGGQRLCQWAIAGDDWVTRLLADAGFAPAGIARTLSVEAASLTQHLWYTDLETTKG